MLDAYAVSVSIGWWLAVGVFAYFLPTVIAFTRRDRDRKAIAILNAATGWTGIGWLTMLFVAAIPRNVAE